MSRRAAAAVVLAASCAGGLLFVPGGVPQDHELEMARHESPQARPAEAGFLKALSPDQGDFFTSAHNLFFGLTVGLLVSLALKLEQTSPNSRSSCFRIVKHNMRATIVLASIGATLFQRGSARTAPRVPPHLDKKYRITADTREVVTYTRLSDHVCTYPNDEFYCKDIAGQNTSTAVHQCGVCAWMPIGFGQHVNSGGVYFCAEDGSSYIKIHYGDRECQNYRAYPGEDWPDEEVERATDSEPTCNVTGKCSNQTPPVYCDLRDWNPGCDAEPKCDHNPPACTGGCCPAAGGAGSESLHVELAYWKIQEQKYVCGTDGSCAPSSHAGKGGLLADCQSACTKPSEGRYACVDGGCVPCGNNCSGISLVKCQTVCPAKSTAMLQI